MSGPAPDLALECRALVLAPLGRDAAVAAALLGEGGIPAVPCPSLPALMMELERGAGLVLVTQEGLLDADLSGMAAWIAGQPAWSDLPFIVVTQRGGGPERNAAERRLVDTLGNVSFIERPFHPFTLVSVSRTALRSRQKQHQARERLAELASQARALVEGEARLAQSEALFRSTFEQAAVGIAHVGLDGRWLRLNDRFCRMLGYSEAELQAMTFQDVTHPGDLATDLDKVRAMVAGRIDAYSMEKRYYRKGGEPFWVHLTVSMLREADGTPRHFVSVVEDISDRKATAAALAESQARLQAIFDTAPVSIFFAEAPSGRLMFGNAAVERVFRHPMLYSEDASAYGEWEARHDDGTRLAASEYPLAKTLRTGEAAQGEYRFMCGDGVLRWIAVSSTPVRDAAGTVTAAVVACADIDELRQAQAVLARDKQELEHIVEARTGELQAAQAQLAHAQRMEALGQLAGGIAHDFNNVLQAVQGGAKLIERRPDDAARARSLAGMIVQSAARGAAITRRLLAFSRRGDLRAEPVDAALLLGDMHEILAHTLGAGIKVRVETDGSLPPLLADKGQLETVLVNLSTNARDAMDGQGTLGLAAALEVVDGDAPGHPGGLQPGRYIRLSVSDTGVGMPPDVLARATEPFFTTKSVDKGTGLGLAMSRGFSEQSGGGLRIESEVGRGTVVSLCFPVSDAAVPPLPASLKPDVAPPPARARLLMVDDEPSVRDTLAQQMAEEGFAVLTAGSGAEALARLDDGEAVDLVVADLSMPGMDGLALVQEIQRRHPGLPAILLTGFATNAAEIALSGALSGRFTLLRKPIEGTLLAERVAVMLDGDMARPPSHSGKVPAP